MQGNITHSFQIISIVKETFSCQLFHLLNARFQIGIFHPILSDLLSFYPGKSIQMKRKKKNQ